MPSSLIIFGLLVPGGPFYYYQSLPGITASSPGDPARVTLN